MCHFEQNTIEFAKRGKQSLNNSKIWMDKKSRSANYFEIVDIDVWRAENMHKGRAVLHLFKSANISLDSEHSMEIQNFHTIVSLHRLNPIHVYIGINIYTKLTQNTIRIHFFKHHCGGFGFMTVCFEIMTFPLVS